MNTLYITAHAFLRKLLLYLDKTAIFPLILSVTLCIYWVYFTATSLNFTTIAPKSLIFYYILPYRRVIFGPILIKFYSFPTFLTLSGHKNRENASQRLPYILKISTNLNKFECLFPKRHCKSSNLFLFLQIFLHFFTFTTLIFLFRELF